MYIDLREFPLRAAEYRKHAPDAMRERFTGGCAEICKGHAWVCTRDREHTTEHVAVGSSGKYLAAWDDSECEGF